MQAAAKTNDTAGDGTTTATILSAAIIAEGMKIVAAGTNPIQARPASVSASAVRVLTCASCRPTLACTPRREAACGLLPSQHLLPSPVAARDPRLHHLCVTGAECVRAPHARTACSHLAARRR